MSNFIFTRSVLSKYTFARVFRVEYLIYSALAGKKQIRFIMAGLLLLLLSSMGNKAFAFGTEPIAEIVRTPGDPVSHVFPFNPFAPSFPSAPVFPVTPCNPCGPVAPCGPVTPIAPFNPFAPVTPVAPVTPLAVLPAYSA